MYSTPILSDTPDIIIQLHFSITENNFIGKPCEKLKLLQRSQYILVHCVHSFPIGGNKY